MSQNEREQFYVQDAPAAPTTRSSQFSPNRLKIFIDGRWALGEMNLLLGSLNNLYEHNRFLKTIRQYSLNGIGDKTLNQIVEINRARIQSFWGDRESLISMSPYVTIIARGITDEFSDSFQVNEIRYSSPGFIDLLGASEIVGTIKDVTLKILGDYKELKKRKIEESGIEQQNDILVKEVVKKELETYLTEAKRHQQFKELLGKIGFKEDEITPIFSHELENFKVLMNYIISERITTAN